MKVFNIISFRSLYAAMLGLIGGISRTFDTYFVY